MSTLPVQLREYDGDREALRPPFREADDSEQHIDTYLRLGEILVAEHDGEIVGHAQLIDLPDNEIELMSIAVLPRLRGAGIGQFLVATAISKSARAGRRRMLVATAAADTSNLRFYQRMGFRMLSVERDAFGPDTGYDNIVIDGIPLRDRVWLDQSLLGKSSLTDPDDE